MPVPVCARRPRRLRQRIDGRHAAVQPQRIALEHGHRLRRRKHIGSLCLGRNRDGEGLNGHVRQRHIQANQPRSREHDLARCQLIVHKAEQYAIATGSGKRELVTSFGIGRGSRLPENTSTLIPISSSPVVASVTRPSNTCASPDEIPEMNRISTSSPVRTDCFMADVPILYRAIGDGRSEEIDKPIDTADFSMEPKTPGWYGQETAQKERPGPSQQEVPSLASTTPGKSG